jgi:hypothetical protein
MRSLLRFLIDHPVLLFSVLATAAIGSAIVAFVMAERRARAMAELAEDERVKGNQVVRLIVIGMSTVMAIAAAAWWSFFRVYTEPQKLVIVVAIDPRDGQPPVPWWDDARGSIRVAEHLEAQFEELGLEPIAIDYELANAMAGSLDEAAFAERARKLEARWVVSVVVGIDKTIPLIGTETSDYVLGVDAAVIDSETGERWPIDEQPLRAFLWGETPAAAVELNAEYLGHRLTLPIAASLAEREPLAQYVDPDAQKNLEETTRARKLQPLFERRDDRADGLALRERDRQAALEHEPENRADVVRTRLGDILGQEYMIGTAFDGRPLLMVDSKHVSVVPDKRGYVVTSEGEAIELASLDQPSTRTQVFEHYNIYSASEVSADGRVIWATLANHGATKTLATISVPEGVYAPVYTHPTEYMTSPLPAPDGSRAVFYARDERYAASAIDVIDRDGQNRRRLVETDEVAGRPAWAKDGRSVYLPMGEWERIVAIDLDTLARTHVLGTPPDGSAFAELPEPQPPANQDVPLAETEPVVDPRTTSRFPMLSLGHDGTYLFVIEDALDGVRWVGRYDFASSQYQRLASVDAQWLEASPNAPRVAVQVRDFTHRDDARPGDDELLVLGPEPQDVTAVTLDTEDDELLEWSRDGGSVFGLQRSSDPGARDRPVVRVYRYELARD